MTSIDPNPVAVVPRDWRRLALYLLLGFSAGLPFYMFNAVLLLRLAKHGVDIVTIGFFAWVALLPTFKFLWAPLLDKYDVPGFARFWGKRRGWIMLAQLGIFVAMLAMAFTSSDANLPVTALFAVVLAFWTTTLEVSADAWRIELAPTAEQQGPMVAANLWGYRSAMVAAGSGAIYVAAKTSWTWAYLVIAAAAFLPFPILAAMRPDPHASAGRSASLTTGLIASAVILGITTIAAAGLGWGALAAIGSSGMSNPNVVSYWVFGIALVPFLAMGCAVPWIRTLTPAAPARTSAAIGPYIDIFWRYGYLVIPILLFVSIYRMGDVMALTLSHPLFNSIGYSLEQISVADGAVALFASMAGVALGGLVAARWAAGPALVIGAVMSALSNWIFAWLALQHPHALNLYVAMGVDQFGHGFEGAVFVVYLSMLVNPLYPGAQYAFLSGLAFLLPRLLAGASGIFQKAMGYHGYFLMSGAMSLAALLFVPLLVNARPRPDDLP